MTIFPWKKKKDFFSEEEKQRLLESIRKAEMRTSGEVRLFIESKCRYMDAVDRATEIFMKLKMQETAERNATLIYVAVDDRQAAILGDEGIHLKVGKDYWEAEVAKMLREFQQNHLVEGLSQVINDLGEALYRHFPYDSKTDKNELPDEIVFGS